jgi:biopolymer transport protein TolR
MGMGGGGTGGAVSEINVTPLIDVLLVLLIIFMVIVPVTPKGLEALVPQPPKDKTQNQEPDLKTVVVQILANGGGAPTYKINDDTYNKADIEPRLLQIFSTRNDKVMFVKGDKDLDYDKVEEMIDAGKQAGVDNIGLITPKVESGQ